MKTSLRRSVASALTLAALVAMPVGGNALGASRSPAADEAPVAEGEKKSESEKTEFRNKLEQLLERLEKSIEVTRSQILANPNAPFLPNLYLQLGELLAQKAETLYFLEAERAEGTPPSTGGRIQRASQDAVQTLQRLEHDFPKFERRPKALLLLTAAYKVGADFTRFKATVEKLWAEFPASVEAAKGRLLLGEHYFENREYDDARATLAPLLESSHVLEKNGARYRTGLVNLSEERFAPAMDLFAKVVADPALEAAEQSAPQDTGPGAVRSGGRQTSLKRDALIDSVRAYTHLYPDGGDAVGYYSNLAPNELYFQEVMEKLAYRYVILRKPAISIRIMRSVAPRTRDVERILKIYVDILSKVRAEERGSLTPAELEAAISAARTWSASYQVSDARRKQIETFLENQVRELGTNAQAHGDLPRAAAFYRLYLDWMPSSSIKARIAINLGDTELARKKFAECGETYLRAYMGEHGPGAKKETVIRGAVLCAQQTKVEGFYEQMRARGVLIKAIQQYLAGFPAAGKDGRLPFALLKAQYDQGLYVEALPKLLDFAKRNRGSKLGVSAGEIVLDYYNVRGDLKGLHRAVDQLLAMQFSDQQFVARLNGVKKGVALRRLDETADKFVAQKGGSTSEGYLSAATMSDDSGIRDAALQQALASARAEGDLDVFIKSGELIASRQTVPAKRAELLEGLSSECIRAGRLNCALAESRKIADSSGYPASSRLHARLQLLNLSISLHDVNSVSAALDSSLSAQLDASARVRALALLTAAVESDLALSPRARETALREARRPEASALRLALYRSSSVSAGDREALIGGCSDAGGQLEAVCAYEKLSGLDARQQAFLDSVARSNTLEATETHAKALEGLSAAYNALEGVGDPVIDSIRLIREKEMLSAFGAYLGRMAAANADFKAVLDQKAAESVASARKAGESCQSISQKAGTNPATRYCPVGSARPALAAMLAPAHGSGKAPKPFREESDSAAAKAQQKQLFKDFHNDGARLALAEVYLHEQRAHPALAIALMGAAQGSTRAGEFYAIAGCAALNLGFVREAREHLGRATEYKGMKARCLNELR